MTNMFETLTYQDLDALLAMTFDEIEALWDLVPTDRQRMYRANYERIRRDEGASGSDADEAVFVEQLLEKYADYAMVPVGTHWALTPGQIQVAARANAPFGESEEDAPVTGPRPGPLLIGLAGAVLVLIVFMMLRGVSGSGSRAASVLAGTRTVTPTLVRTWTPTPLALDSQDAIIRGGNTGSAAASIYPVNLRVSVADSTVPRVFVVQRRAVITAEWVYDDNPDVASYIAGLIVHPVIGIPWSEANAALFQNAVPGDRLVVQMNTGTVSTFTVRTMQSIGRAETGLFAQSEPGLTLVLFGEGTEDPDNRTGRRAVIVADYVPSDSVLSAQLPTLTAAPTLAERVDVQVISVTTQPGRLTCRLRIYNGTLVPLRLDDTAVWLALGYAERPVGPRVAAEIPPVQVQPGQAADVSVMFAWHGELYASLGVTDGYRFAIAVSSK